jgi:hypothetical protein
MKPKVPKAKQKPTPKKLKAPPSVEIDDPVTVRIDENDPISSVMWDAGLQAILGYQRYGLGWRWTGRYDPKPMAAALMTNDPIPQDVRRLLATVLDPHKNWLGPKAKIDQRPKKSIHSAMKSLAKRRNIRDDYLAGLALNQKAQYLEATLAIKYGVQRTFIRDSINLSDKDLVEQSCQILGVRLIGDVNLQT